MGIHRETREWYTCDVCKKECVKPTQKHSLVKNKYMDMEPSKVIIAITYEEPFDSPDSAGFVCRHCQIDNLRLLAQQLEDIGKEFEMQN